MANAKMLSSPRPVPTTYGDRLAAYLVKNADRLGPYPSDAEAAWALEKVEERNETWDNDPDWNDDVEQR